MKFYSSSLLQSRGSNTPTATLNNHGTISFPMTPLNCQNSDPLDKRGNKLMMSWFQVTFSS